MLQGVVGAGDRDRTGDVQLGKTLHFRILNGMAFPEYHRNARSFPNFVQHPYERSTNGVSLPASSMGQPEVNGELDKFVAVLVEVFFEAFSQFFLQLLSVLLEGLGGFGSEQITCLF